LEAGELVEHDAPKLDRIRASFEGADGRSGSLQDRLADTSSGVPGFMRVQVYADRLHVHRSTGTSTTLTVITAAVEEVWGETGEAPLVIVDYLQKVRIPEAAQMVEDERITLVVEGLKDLAIDAGVPVLAIVAADKDGIESGRRTRAQHMRGSTALAYEPDTLLVLNNKFDAVARHHLVYDTSAADRFHEWVVMSIEKNRSGRDGIDLEFKKVFEQSRFDPDGNLVAERLIDDRVYVE
ncbi:MAG: DnaB-like helicase C-terminal domain-containing protein, partial [Nocardioides sp.]